MVAVPELDVAYREAFPDSRVPPAFRPLIEALDQGQTGEVRQALSKLIDRSEAAVAGARTVVSRRNELTQKAIALDLQARISLREFQVDEAIENYKKSFDARKAINPDALWESMCAAGRHLRELASLTGHAGAAITAVALFRDAVELAPAESFPFNELGQALYELGHRTHDYHLFGAAKDALNQAVRQAERSAGHSEALARARINLAAMLSAIGDQANERRRFDEAVAILRDVLRNLNRSEMWARAQDNLATALMGQEQITDAIVAYEAALQEFHEPREKARCHLNTGVAYTRNHKYDHAYAHFQQASALQPDDGKTPLFRANIYHNIGLLWSVEAESKIDANFNENNVASSKLESAARHFEAARQLRRPDLAPFDWAASTVGLADVYLLFADVQIDQPSPRPEVSSQLLTALGLYLDALEHLPEWDRRGVFVNIRRLILRFRSFSDNVFAFTGLTIHSGYQAKYGRKEEGDVRRGIRDEFAGLEALYWRLTPRQKRVLLANLATSSAAAEKGLTVAEVLAVRPVIERALTAPEAGSVRAISSIPEAPANLQATVAGLIAERFPHLPETERSKAETVVLATLGAGQANDTAKLNVLFEAARTEVCEPPPPPRRLSGADAETFKAFLIKNPWTEASGKSASEFIRIDCAWWLARDLALTDIRSAQPKLAASYSAEISRDPSKRLPEIYVRPHKLPKGSPTARSNLRASELSEEELLSRRMQDAKRQAKKSSQVASRNREP